MITFRRTLIALLALCVILLLAAPVAADISARQDTEPVTLYRAGIVPVSTVDPQIAGADADVVIIENLFLGLTNVHPLTGDIVPELATHWEVSDLDVSGDRRVWTFYLRDDVPWVRWDPITQTSQVLRHVTAHDVVYGFQRLCDPRVEGYSVPAQDMIQGCPELLAIPLTEITDQDYALVEVRTLDDTTVEIHLQHAAGYFLPMSAMWVFHPVPRGVIEEHSLEWTVPGTIITNGPYMLDRWTPGERLDVVQNPHMPGDLRGPGNIERVISIWMFTFTEVFPLYVDHQIDAAVPPPSEMDNLQNDPQYDDQRLIQYGACVLFFGFAYDNPPFDNVHVRRAFSAAFDRQDFIDQHVQGGVYSPATPMIHFTPPGLFGAPPIDEPGVGYDPDYAREQLALGGYPDCEGFPEIRIWTWERAAHWGEYLVQSAVTVLGCDVDKFLVEPMPDPVLVQTCGSNDLPPEEQPEICTNGWCPDFLDAHSFVGYITHCESMNPFHRPCNEIDDLIDQAARETDMATRAALYYDIEERFFGPEGEHPMIPKFLGGGLRLYKPWYSGPFVTDFFGHFDWYTIDQEAQLAARGG